MSVVLMFTFALVGCGDSDETATADITQPPGDGGKADGFFDDFVDGIEDVFDGDEFEEIPTEEGAGQIELNVWNGDVTEDNIHQLKPYHVIDGRFNLFDDHAITKIDLPNLIKVRGQMLIRECSELTEINLPRLHTVSGPVGVTTNPKLKHLRLPKLQTVGKVLDLGTTIGNAIEGGFSVDNAFVVQRNFKLETLDISQLRHVKGSFVIDKNTDTDSRLLTTIDVPQLETVGKTLYIASQLHMTTLLLPQLRTVGDDLEIRRNFELTSIKLPRLETIDDKLTVYYNGSVEHILFPVLTEIGGDWLMRDNDDLVTILMPELENASGEVTINDSVDTCDLGSYTEEYCY